MSKTAHSNVNVLLSTTLVEARLRRALGALPVSLLPFGNRRLFERQLPGEGQRAIVLLPAGHELEPADAHRLEEREVEPVFAVTHVDPWLNLLQSLTQLRAHLQGKPVTLTLSFGDLVVESPLEPQGEEGVWIYRLAQQGPARVGLGTPETCRVWSDEAGSLGLIGAIRVAQSEDFFACLDEAESLVDALRRYRTLHPSFAVSPVDCLRCSTFESYFQSRAAYFEARSFNRVFVKDNRVCKLSQETDKIAAEARWLQSIPRSLRDYAPRVHRVFTQGKLAGYETEYLKLHPLNELYLFSNLPENVWEGIRARCEAALQDFLDHRPQPRGVDDPDGFAARVYEQLYVAKTSNRLRSFAEQANLDLDTGWCLNGRILPGLSQVASFLLRCIPPTRWEDICFWHGDFCFSNLFYCAEQAKIMLIDPRGQLSPGSFSQFGDRRYDLAKLGHSALDGYDLVCADRWHAHRSSQYGLSSPRLAWPVAERVRASFAQLRVGGLALRDPEIRAITGLLFLSMLPLHRDHERRQWTFLAKALEIYVELADSRSSAKPIPSLDFRRTSIHRATG